MKQIKIAILEDLKDVSEHLKLIFNREEDMICTQVYQNAEDAMHFLVANPADILVVDIGLPRASGIEAIRYLTEHCPAMEYCMFTVYEDDDKIFNSLQAGAKGYILKSATADKIVAAVRELHEGGSPMSPIIARKVLTSFKKFQMMPVVAALPLTTRELEILQLLSRGQLYKEIGDKLDITIGTVKQHIHKIYGKLQVSNKTEAINKLNETRKE